MRQTVQQDQMIDTIQIIMILPENIIEITQNSNIFKSVADQENDHHGHRKIITTIVQQVKIENHQLVHKNRQEP